MQKWESGGRRGSQEDPLGGNEGQRAEPFEHTKYFGHIPLNMVALPNGGSLLSQIRMGSRCLWEIIFAMIENN